MAKKRKFLITGCAGSATHYITKFLSHNFNLSLFHETMMGDDGIVSWGMAFPGNNPWGPNAQDYQFDVVLHQTREPFKTLSFLHTLYKPSWTYIKECIKIPKKTKLLESCMIYYYQWNLQCEKISQMTYPIEDLREHIPTICEMLDLDPSLAKRYKFPKSSRSHFRKRVEVKWSDMKLTNLKLAKQIRAMAVRYGYDM